MYNSCCYHYLSLSLYISLSLSLSLYMRARARQAGPTRAQNVAPRPAPPRVDAKGGALGPLGGGRRDFGCMHDCPRTCRSRAHPYPRRRW